jgi:hypothetical protein
LYGELGPDPVTGRIELLQPRQHAIEPPELGADRGRHVIRHDLALQRERGTQPLDGGSHPARGIRSVQPHQRVGSLEFVHDHSQSSAQNLTYRCLATDRRSVGQPRARRAEYPAQLRRAARGLHVRRPDSGVQRSEDRPVAVDQLDLELAPGDGRTLHVMALTSDEVIGQLSEHTTVTVRQHVHGAAVDQRGHRFEPVRPDEPAHQRRQCDRWCLAPAERAMHLEPLTVGEGQLEVPAVVRSTGAPAQRCTGRSERVVGGVEVGGSEHHRLLHDDSVNPTDPDQLGDLLPIRDVVLCLDLEVCLHRTPVTVVAHAAGSCRS